MPQKSGYLTDIILSDKEETVSTASLTEEILSEKAKRKTDQSPKKRKVKEPFVLKPDEMPPVSRLEERGVQYTPNKFGVARRKVERSLETALNLTKGQKISSEQALESVRPVLQEAVKISDDPDYVRKVYQRKLSRYLVRNNIDQNPSWWRTFFSNAWSNIKERTSVNLPEVDGKKPITSTPLSGINELIVGLGEDVTRTASAVTRDVFRDPSILESREKIIDLFEVASLSVLKGIQEEELSDQAKRFLELQMKDSRGKEFLAGIAESVGFIANMSIMGKFIPRFAKLGKFERAVRTALSAGSAEWYRGGNTDEVARTAASWGSMILIGDGMLGALKLGKNQFLGRLPDAARNTGAKMYDKINMLAPDWLKKYLKKIAPGAVKFGEDRAYDFAESMQDGVAFAAMQANNSEEFIDKFVQGSFGGIIANVGSEIALDVVLSAADIPSKLRTKYNRKAAENFFGKNSEIFSEKELNALYDAIDNLDEKDTSTVKETIDAAREKAEEVSVPSEDDAEKQVAEKEIDLDPKQKEFIENRVKELGDIEAVKKEYNSGDDVSRYAVEVAENIYGEAKPEQSAQTENPEQERAELKNWIDNRAAEIQREKNIDYDAAAQIVAQEIKDGSVPSDIFGYAEKHLPSITLDSETGEYIEKGEKEWPKADTVLDFIQEREKEIDIDTEPTLTPLEAEGFEEREEELAEEEIRKELEGSTAEEFVERGDITNYIRKSFGVPIKKGGISIKGALGLYKKKPEVIRTRLSNMLQTVSHEIGHHIENVENIEIPEQYDEELSGIATKGDSKEEGFAEFIRLYLSRKNTAMVKAPEFYTYFSEQLKERPELYEKITTLQRMIAGYYAGTPYQKIGSMISKDSKDNLADDSWWRRATNAYAWGVDQWYPILAVGKKIGGEARQFAARAYVKARLLAGWAGKAEYFLQEATFDSNLKNNGESYSKIINKIDENELDSFRSYLIALRALEWNKRGLVSGISSKIAEKVVAEVETDKFKSVASDLYAYQDRLLRYLVESGALDKDTYTKIKKLNKFYVPFYRALGDDVRGSGKDLTKPPSVIKKATGSRDKIIDPLESIIKNTYALINAAERNKVSRSIVAMGLARGSGWAVERVPIPMRPISFDKEEGLRAIFGKEYKEKISEEDKDSLGEIVSIFRPQVFNPGNNRVLVKINGKNHLYEVDPLLFQTMENLRAHESDIITTILSKPAQLLRAGATLTPEFMARNPVRDIFTAFMYGAAGPKQFLYSIKGLKDAVAQNQWYLGYQKAGGGHVAIASLDREGLRVKLKDIRSGKFGRIKSILNPLEALRSVSAALEAGSRVGEFRKRLDEAGVDLDTASLRQLENAAFSARDVTLDFANRGYSPTLRSLGMMTAFQNAGIRGVDKLAREIKNNPKRLLLRGFVGLTLPSLYLWYLNHDKEWYKETPQWEKDLFWLIRIGTQKNGQPFIVRVPKPFEAGLIFSSVPERIADYIADNDPRKLKTVLKTLGTSFIPPLFPEFAKTPLEIYFDKNTFTGRPVEPRSKKRLNPGLRSTRYGSEVIKDIGKKLDISPSKMEHFIKGWGAGTATHVLDIIDYFYGKKETSRGAADTPIVKGFVSRYPKMSSDSINLFYDYYEDTMQSHASLSYFLNKSTPGSLDMAVTYSENNPEFFIDAALYQFLSVSGRKNDRFIPKVARALSNMRNIIYTIQESDIPQEKKDIYVARLQITMSKVARDANRIISESRNEMRKELKIKD